MEDNMKRIECGDLVPGCTFHAQAASEAEVLSAELEHVRQVHGLTATPQFLERARGRIVDVDDAEAAPAGVVRRRGAGRG
jgi:predicted small metal-binding protein